MDLYLISLIVGGGLFALSLLGGHDSDLGSPDVSAPEVAGPDFSGPDLSGPELHAPDIHGHLLEHDLGAEHPESGDVASWFSLRALVSFVTFFGLAGVLGGLAGVGGGTRLAMALVSGLVLGGFTAWLFRLARTRGEVHSAAGRLAGRTGQVIVPPAPGRPGRVVVAMAGQLEQASAISVDTLRPGDRVIVIGESRGVLDVKAWDGD